MWVPLEPFPSVLARPVDLLGCEDFVSVIHDPSLKVLLIPRFGLALTNTHPPGVKLSTP